MRGKRKRLFSLSVYGRQLSWLDWPCRLWHSAWRPELSPRPSSAPPSVSRPMTGLASTASGLLSTAPTRRRLSAIAKAEGLSKQTIFRLKQAPTGGIGCVGRVGAVIADRWITAHIGVAMFFEPRARPSQSQTLPDSTGRPSSGRRDSGPNEVRPTGDSAGRRALLFEQVLPITFWQLSFRIAFPQMGCRFRRAWGPISSLARTNRPSHPTDPPPGFRLAAWDPTGPLVTVGMQRPRRSMAGKAIDTAERTQRRFTTSRRRIRRIAERGSRVAGACSSGRKSRYLRLRSRQGEI